MLAEPVEAQRRAGMMAGTSSLLATILPFRMVPRAFDRHRDDVADLQRGREQVQPFRPRSRRAHRRAQVPEKPRTSPAFTQDAREA